MSKRCNCKTRRKEFTINKYWIVHQLGKILKWKDWKSKTDKILRKPGNWHFNFNPCKRFISKKGTIRWNVVVQGEVFYKTNSYNPKLVTKKETIYRYWTCRFETKNAVINYQSKRCSKYVDWALWRKLKSLWKFHVDFLLKLLLNLHWNELLV